MENFTVEKFKEYMEKFYEFPNVQMSYSIQTIYTILLNRMRVEEKNETIKTSLSDIMRDLLFNLEHKHPNEYWFDWYGSKPFIENIHTAHMSYLYLERADYIREISDTFGGFVFDTAEEKRVFNIAVSNLLLEIGKIAAFEFPTKPCSFRVYSKEYKDFLILKEERAKQLKNILETFNDGVLVYFGSLSPEV